MNDNNSRLRHRNPATESDHAPVDVRNGLIGYECGRCGGGVSFLPGRDSDEAGEDDAGDETK
jgi:hypothetical protein